MRKPLLFTFALLLAMLLLSACEVYFPQTGHYMQERFLSAWSKFGEIEGCGYPLTEEFLEQSTLDHEVHIVQYNERCLFELHPDNASPNDVLLSLLGRFRYEQKYPSGAPGQQANKEVGSVLFKETSKRLGGRFLEYWNQNGGLARHGYPISDEFWERNELDGKRYLVQYFERSVFEYHPEHAGTDYEVLLAQLGKYELDRRYPEGERDNPAIARQPSPTAQP